MPKLVHIIFYSELPAICKTWTDLRTHMGTQLAETTSCPSQLAMSLCSLIVAALFIIIQRVTVHCARARGCGHNFIVSYNGKFLRGKRFVDLTISA